MIVMTRFLTLGALVAAVVSLLGSPGVAPASAAGTVGWSVRAAAEPTHFSSNDFLRCEREEKCDRYQLLVMNVGDAPSSGTITVTDKLPAGITTRKTPTSGEGLEGEWSCTEGAGQTTVTCTLEGSVPAGAYTPFLDLEVSAPTASMTGSLKNEVSVTGAGTAVVASTSEETPISSQAPEFGVSEFAFEPAGVGGAPTTQAGAHPWEVTASFGIPATFSPPGIANTYFQPVENTKEVAVELPAGFVGDPQAAPRCTQTELRAATCPAASRVGAFAFRSGLFAFDEFTSTGNGGLPPSGCCSAVYNMVPESGYPAEFAFTFANIPVYLYASVVHSGSGYRLRVASPGIPAEIELSGTTITFFGDPGELNGGSSEAAFLTSPTNCAAGPLASRIELAPWEDPGHPAGSEATAYPQLTGCNLLQFNPWLTLAPSPLGPGREEEGTSEADEPSAYSVDLKVPQTSGFSELATPELRDATVTLPQGISVSPASAQGLVGCQAEGPEGINIGSNDIGPEGEDLGDPEATELGAGHAGGNNSPYDDGVYHTAPGHCPEALTLGTVEVTTPLLSSPLHGHIYLAAPKCGGAGQPECTEASATNGELFSGYIEVAGSGVIVKIPGTIAANPQTGQLTGTFKENPQFPFEDLKLHFHGGPRAPIANPQTCGSFATTSTLTSWGGQEVSQPSEPFTVTGCAATMPFAPSFTSGTTIPTAGAFSPFTLTFSRQDREQDLSGLSVTLPPGLLAKIAGVPLCGEAQANAGTCGAESQIGTTSVTAGSGTNPLYVSGGRVYLTQGYKGQPFGLSVVVPAVAGPFNLGNVVVRASIHIDPSTAQVTVTSDPLPQSRDGVPFRLRTVNVMIERPNGQGFTFNPTNCAAQAVTATISSAQGASVGVSSPFAAAGCKDLPFHPDFSASTAGKTSKALGATLNVKITSAGLGQANIAKVNVEIPKALPTQLKTLNHACTEAQFAANPANCPPASDIAQVTVHTPLLNSPLKGPAYLVSHGNAAFPDVEMVLQGEGVTLVLDGHTQIKQGVTYSHFETVPDAPFTSFEFSSPQGELALFTANGDLCDQKLTMPTELTGQNGAVLTQSTHIEVEGCPTSVSVKSKTVNKRTVKLSVYAPAAGKLTASGKGLSSVSKSYSGQEAQSFTLTQKKAGKLKTKIKLSFTPSKGKKQSKSVTVEFKR